ISMDLFTKIDKYQQKFIDAGLTLPNIHYGSTLVEWRPFTGAPTVANWGYQIQDFEDDGITLQDEINASRPGLERQKTYERVYTKIGRIMLQLQAADLVTSRNTLSPYGQYGDAQYGDIRCWDGFSDYLNHTLSIHELVLGSAITTRLPIPLDVAMIHRALHVVKGELSGATMHPHLVHGDLQPQNILRSGTLIDPDNIGYGNTWIELAKPLGRILKNNEALRAMHHGLRSPDGMNLSEEQCSIVLGDAKVGILLDCLDRLTYTLLSITPEEAQVLQNWGDVQTAQRNKLAQVQTYKEGLLKTITKLSQLPDDSGDKEYLRDYESWSLACDQDAERITHQYDWLTDKIKKLGAIQQEMTTVLSAPQTGATGYPLGWRDKRREEIITQLQSQRDPRIRHRLNAELSSLWPV
ncbi:MAG: hypothetical protein ACREBW_02335, partial [Candidatus Micrarchaeaceae archaeon]